MEATMTLIELAQNEFNLLNIITVCELCRVYSDYYDVLHGLNESTLQDSMLFRNFESFSISWNSLRTKNYSDLANKFRLSPEKKTRKLLSCDYLMRYSKCIHTTDNIFGRSLWLIRLCMKIARCKLQMSFTPIVNLTLR